MIGNQSIGDPPISIIKGNPKAAPPKPSPVLTKPDQEKTKATTPNSNAVKLIFSYERSYCCRHNWYFQQKHLSDVKALDEDFCGQQTYLCHATKYSY